MLRRVRATGRSRAARLGMGLGDVQVLVATLIWSVNVVVVKAALTQSGPLTYAAVRFLIGGLGLWLMARWIEGPLPSLRGRELWWVLAAAAAGTAANQASFTAALALNSADFVALIQVATPLMVAVWLALRGTERFGRRVWFGLLVGLAGLLLVVDTGGGAQVSWLGTLVALATPTTWAVYLLILPRLLGRYSALSLSALVTLYGALMLLPFGAVESVISPPRLSPGWFGLMAFSAIAAVVITNWAFLHGAARLGAARTAAYTYVQPFASVLAAALLIGERVVPLQLLGGVVMLLGIAVGRPRPRPAGETSDRTPLLRPGPAPGETDRGSGSGGEQAGGAGQIEDGRTHALHHR